MKSKQLFGLITIVILTILTLVSGVESSTLTWEVSSGIVTGYKIYVGTQSGSYTTSQDVGNVLEYNIANLYSAGLMSYGTAYYLTVKAYNNDGEGNSTEEVNYGLGVPMAVILTDGDNPNEDNPIYKLAKLIYIDSEGNIVFIKEHPHNNIWHPLSISLASNGQGSMLWDNLHGTAVIWFLDENGNKTSYQIINYTAGLWYPRCHSINSDGTAELLWDNLQGTTIIWFLDATRQHASSQQCDYTNNVWFLTSYMSNQKGGLFIWDNIQQSPLSDTWLWLDEGFASSGMDKYKTNHYTDSWTPISGSIQGEDDIEDTTLAWIDSSGQRVVVHWMHKGIKTGKYLDITRPNEIIWFDAR